MPAGYHNDRRPFSQEGVNVRNGNFNQEILMDMKFKRDSGPGNKQGDGAVAEESKDPMFAMSG